MDEVAERAKLQLLDLTEDVIELILEKKRRTYASRILVQEVVPEMDEVPADQVEEPTYYPPVVVSAQETVPRVAEVHLSQAPPHSRWGWFSK